MNRPRGLKQLHSSFKVHPVVGLLGPRQCGKFTLARLLASEHSKEPVTLFDLEDPTDLARLEQPKLALQDLRGWIIIDEIQKCPELFPLLRVLADRPGELAKFLVLGSASRDLIQQSSETLAGRIGYIELTPFESREVPDLEKELWIRGGFPRSELAPDEASSFDWRKNYIATYLERDLPQLGITVPALTMRRFWMMLTHYHGQIFNASALAGSLGLSDKTVKRYLDILSGTFMARQLAAWSENIGKRQVKSPKIYFRDSGILHCLMSISNESELLSHPRLGASWEGFALEEVIRRLGLAPEECFFWCVPEQAEWDLLVFKGGKKLGFEFKFADAPHLTKSMTQAAEPLKLDELTVIFPGKES
jgi:predicted AAA+ superfamily ATPase